VAEQSATLQCPQEHETEVFWDEGARAPHWHCPTCREGKYRELVAAGTGAVDAAQQATEFSLVPFEAEEAK